MQIQLPPRMQSTETASIYTPYHPPPTPTPPCSDSSLTTLPGFLFGLGCSAHVICPRQRNKGKESTETMKHMLLSLTYSDVCVHYTHRTSFLQWHYSIRIVWVLYTKHFSPLCLSRINHDATLIALTATGEMQLDRKSVV